MENTGKVLFPDDTPQWYIALGESWVGPLTASDVYQRVIEQKISWAHYVWRPGQTGWERICDLKLFQAAVPQLPPRDLQKEVKEAVRQLTIPTRRSVAARKQPPPAPGAAKADPEESLTQATEKIWYLFHNQAQVGPFSAEEVQRFLRIGRVSPDTFAWRDGMEDWARLGKLEGFTGVAPVSSARAEKENRKERRSAPRRPLVARIWMTDEDTLAIGMCRDISVGGMQVLTDKVPGQVGSRVKMNISPSGVNASAGSGSQKMDPFVAEGMIVRVLEDGRGFSFRFDRLSEAAKRRVEEYIAQGD